MNTLHKYTAATLSALIALTLAACSGESGQPSSSSPNAGNTGITESSSVPASSSEAGPAEKDYSEHLTFNVAWTLVYGSDFNSDALAQEWNKRFNVEWEVTALTDMDKLRIWINSGDMPDVAVWTYNHGEALNYSEQELLYRLPDDWKQRWPNAAAAYGYTKLGDELEKVVGGTYILPRPIFTTNMATDPIVWHYMTCLRKDWAQAVNFPVKDTYTVDEILEYARLIKAQDPGGLGDKLIPISTNNTEALRLFIRTQNARAEGFYKDANGQYQWGGADPETLEALKAYQAAFREGLMNPEFFSYKGSESRDAFWVSGQAGVVNCGGTGSLRYTNFNKFSSNIGTDPNDAVQMTIVLDNQGVYHDVEVKNFGDNLIFSPDISQEKFERFMDMVDYSTTEEGQLLINAGFEGVDWERGANNEIVPLNDTPMKEKYPSQDPLFCNMYMMADNYSMVNPTIPQQFRDSIWNDYKTKVSLSSGDSILKNDWQEYFFDSPSKQKVNFNYANEYAQLVVKDGDLEQNWKEWVESKMPLIQPVLDELNSMK